jgi:hypothetical protein
MNKRQLQVAQSFGYLIEEIPGLVQIPKTKYYNKKGEEMVLPADPYSMHHYLRKGYSLDPPRRDEEIPLKVGTKTKSK